jgi:hypothetical protein
MTNFRALSGIRTHDYRDQAIKTYASDRADTGTLIKSVTDSKFITFNKVNISHCHQEVQHNVILHRLSQLKKNTGSL